MPLLPARDDGQADEVDEPPLWVALAVEIQADGCFRETGGPENVDLLLPQGQRLEGEVMRPLLGLDPLAPFPHAEGAGQLGDRGDALAGIVADLLLPHTP